MPFADYEDITIANIKCACQKYFLPRVGKNVICDVLAGEQGPSCSTLEQIPDIKLVHIRFIQRPDKEQLDHMEYKSDIFSPPAMSNKKRKITSDPMPPPTEFKTASTGLSKRMKTFPKSLSVSDMMKLGKVVKKKASTAIALRSFD